MTSTLQQVELDSRTTASSNGPRGTTEAPTRRIGEIDALRGIAALMVVLFHYTSIYDSAFGHGPGFWLRFGIGRQGVELFFMISGFVIFMTLERARGAGDFACARASRLYPVYWLSVLLTAAAVTVFQLPGQEVSVGQLLANLTMFQTFIGIENVDGVYWTMALELAFYGWMALALALGRLSRIETGIAHWLLALAAVVVVLTVRGVSLPWGAATALLLYYGHLFCAGILFYRLRQHATPLVVGLIGVTLAIEWIFHPESILVVACWYGVFLLLVSDRLRFLNRRPLLFLGAISYPLYLIHENIGFIVIRQLYAWSIEDTLLLVLIPLALSIALATAVHYAVEVPAQRALRGWVRRRSAPATATPSAITGGRTYNAGHAPDPKRTSEEAPSWRQPRPAATRNPAPAIISRT